MEGKDSFILYKKYISIIKALSLEQRGKLITHIFEYVNDYYDEEHEDQLDDSSVLIAWLAIKSDLKEDLVKWKKTCSERSKAGKLGAEIKKQKQANQANANFAKNETSKNKQTKANQADNEYEYDCDNEYDNVNDNNDVSISKDISTSTSEPRELALELPTIKGNYGTSYPVYKDQVEKWQSIYLGVNVVAELNKMYAWLEANPKNKKTYQGMPRFIVNWLSRQQDRASKNGVSAVPTYNDGTYKGFTFVDGIYYEGGFRAEIVPPDVRLHFEGGK